MSDEERKVPDDSSEQQPEEPNETPDSANQAASSLFLEMMRQAAETHDMAEQAFLEEFTGSSDEGDFDDIDTAYEFDPEDQVTDTTEEDSELIIVSAEPQMSAEQLREHSRTRREQRTEERSQKRRSYTFTLISSFIRTVWFAGFVAILAGTMFTWFTDPNFITPNVVSQLQVAQAPAIEPTTIAPTALSTPNYLRKVGIVSGHRGPEDDPGAVCPDGLTEVEINFNVAQIVVRNLRNMGYSVDLLDEFDPRLENYRAAALISIHSNTCQDFGEYISGYMVAQAAVRPDDGPDAQLAECVARNYEQATRLVRRFTLTIDMTDYHTFREIHPLTPAAILELGFMLGDRELLENQPELVARGVTDGILCYLQAGDAPLPSGTLTPTAISALPTPIVTSEP